MLPYSSSHMYSSVSMERVVCVLRILPLMTLVILMILATVRGDQYPKDAVVEAVSVNHGSKPHTRVKRARKPLEYGILDKTKDSVNHTDRELFITSHNKARSIVDPTSTNMLFMVSNYCSCFCVKASGQNSHCK